MMDSGTYRSFQPDDHSGGFFPASRHSPLDALSATCGGKLAHADRPLNCDDSPLLQRDHFGLY